MGQAHGVRPKSPIDGSEHLTQNRSVREARLSEYILTQNWQQLQRVLKEKKYFDQDGVRYLEEKDENEEKMEEDFDAAEQLNTTTRPPAAMTTGACISEEITSLDESENLTTTSSAPTVATFASASSSIAASSAALPPPPSLPRLPSPPSARASSSYSIDLADGEIDIAELKDEAAQQQQQQPQSQPQPSSSSSASFTSIAASSSAAAASSSFTLRPRRFRYDLSTLPINKFTFYESSFTPLHLAAAACSPLFIKRLINEEFADVNALTKGGLMRHGHEGRPSFYRWKEDKGIEEEEKQQQQQHQNAASNNQQQRPPCPRTYRDHLPRQLPVHLKYRELHYTPLMLACLFSSDSDVCQVVETLLCSGGGGANINAVTTPSSCSAGHLTAARGHTELWCLLLSYGFDTTLMNNEGDVALSAAERWSGSTTMRVIQEATRVYEEKNRRIQQVLGDEFNMAQVCVDIVVYYAGLVCR